MFGLLSKRKAEEDRDVGINYQSQLGLEHCVGITLICCDCNQSFAFAPGEQRFYAEKELSTPKRCPRCREWRRYRRTTDGANGNGGNHGHD